MQCNKSKNIKENKNVFNHKKRFGNGGERREEAWKQDTFQTDFCVNGGRESKYQLSGRSTEKEKGQMKWHDSLLQKLERTWQLRTCLKEGMRVC